MNKITEVVFLCGGYGSRMGTLGKKRQKCMLPYKGKPIMEHGLQAVYDHLGPFRPIFAVAHRAEDVRTYFGESWNDLPITYVEHPHGIESRGAIQSLKKTISNRNFITIHGNITFDGGILPKMLSVHAKHEPLTTMAIATKVEESSHDLVKLNDDGSVNNILLPYPGQPTLDALARDGVTIETYPQSLSYDDMRSNGYMREPGINVFNEEIFDHIESYPASVTHITWLYADYLQKNGELRGVIHEADWIHFQTPDDLER